MPDSLPVFDWVIQGGILITRAGPVQADLGIHGEKIAAIGSELKGRESLDAAGQYVIPGGVDPHVHLETPVGSTYSSDDWYSGSLAAAYGGTTTILDFVEPAPGQPLQEALQERIRQAQGRAVVDYGLHMTLTSAAPSTIDQLAGLRQAGCSSYKVYTTYDGFRLDDESILAVLQAARSRQALVMVHAEDDAILQSSRQQVQAIGSNGPSAHPRSRPPQAESTAARRVLALAAAAGAPVYLVHLSTAGSVDCLTQAQQQGQPAFGESCPQYLLLDESAYNQEGFEGAKYVCSPPLRTKADQEHLWEALQGGILQTIGTDHCPFFYHGQKELGRDDYTKIPGGLPGIESRISLLYTYGVMQGRLSLGRWVELCATNPAKLFGLYPRKGCLEPGSDADIVLFDPRRKGRLSLDTLHEHVDYTPYEGFELEGMPAGVFLRGEPLFLPGRDFSPISRGNFLACGTSHTYEH